MPQQQCEANDHKFQYAGLRFAHGSNPRPGSGSVTRYYAQVYFCEKCLTTMGTPVWQTDSYSKIEGGATPGTPDECGVPLEDRPYGGR